MNKSSSKQEKMAKSLKKRLRSKKRWHQSSSPKTQMLKNRRLLPRWLT